MVIKEIKRNFETLLYLEGECINALLDIRINSAVCRRRFGAVIYETKGHIFITWLNNIFDLYVDFLALDSLLTLLARLLPIAQKERAERSGFIQDVFMQPDISYGSELARILEHIKKEDWNDISARLLDVLSKHDISRWVSLIPERCF